MRLFLAIHPSDPVRDGLHEATGHLRERDWPVKWVPAENVHLTLKFLGEVSEERLPELKEAVDGVTGGGDPFELEVGGLGAFPSLRNPRVIWVGAEATPELAAVQEGIEEAMASLGFERERRDFHPHFTLGRVRKRARSSDLAGLPAEAERFEYSARFRVQAVDLMRSRLRPQGAVYDVVHRAGLDD